VVNIIFKGVFVKTVTIRVDDSVYNMIKLAGEDIVLTGLDNLKNSDNTII